MHELERIAAAAFLELYGERATRLGGAIALRSSEVPGSPMLNRVVGLGVDTPATETELDELLALMEGRTFYVAVSPTARPAALPDWLAARGLEPGWGWMLFSRSVEEPPRAETSLRLVELESAPSEAFARIVATGYGLPGEVVPWLAQAPLAGWTCWLALDGDAPVAAAALHVAGGAGYLGFAATLAEARGRGAQGALLAARIGRARELGARLLVTETGERREGLPSNSYRNLLRVGFREEHVVAHWVGERRRG